VSIKAEWHLSELELGEGDPFDNVILSTGLTVDLTGSEADIYEGLKRTIDLESRLFNRGITCDLKDAGQDCLACPKFTGDPGESRMPLCRLGRDQRTLIRRADSMRQVKYKPYRVLGGQFQGYAEISDTYADLLGSIHATEDRAFTAAAA
jgi:hypothetical protein